MEKMLNVREILASIREDEQKLEKLIVDLRKEKKPFCPTRQDSAPRTAHSACPH
jgi:hypothetical protein